MQLGAIDSSTDHGAYVLHPRDNDHVDSAAGDAQEKVNARLFTGLEEQLSRFAVAILFLLSIVILLPFLLFFPSSSPFSLRFTLPPSLSFPSPTSIILPHPSSHYLSPFIYPTSSHSSSHPPLTLPPSSPSPNYHSPSPALPPSQASSRDSSGRIWRHSGSGHIRRHPRGERREREMRRLRGGREFRSKRGGTGRRKEGERHK